MKKLTLESLEVTSFDTLPTPRERGTVQGHETIIQDPSFGAETYCDNCGPTNPNFDCTYGCSQDTACDDQCYMVQP